MRVLVVQPGPHFSVQDVSNGWVSGLRKVGCTVVDFNFNERLNFYASAHIPKDGELKRAFTPPEAAQLAAKGIEAAAYEFQPDVVLIVSGFFIPPAIYELIRLRGSKVVLLHTESPYEDDRQIPRAAFADLNILNDPTNLERFRQVAPSEFLPHAFDPDVHHPASPIDEARSDFCFVGTGYDQRAAFFEAVDWTGIDVALGGNWRRLSEDSPLRKFLAHDIEECCPNDVTATLYASTKISANLYRKEATESADGWAMGPREVELAACGTFFLREARGESDGVLSMLPTISGPEDFGDQVRYWLSRPEQRAELARRARMAVQDRTFAHNAKRLLELLA